MTPHQEPAPTRCQTGQQLWLRYLNGRILDELANHKRYLAHVNKCRQCAAWRKWSQRRAR